MKKNNTVDVNKGWSAIEVLGVLAVVSFASVYGATMMSDHMDEIELDVAALHATSVNEAAKTYISDNTDDILSKTTATKSILITTSTLLNRGYLQKGFSEVNTFGQTYSVAVKRNPLKTNKLEAYTVTKGGTPLSFKGMRYLSKKIIGMGGYVYPNNIANGAGGGWQTNLSEFGLAVPEGHVAISLSSEVLGTASQESDRLYRFRVNGRPDLNAMHTDIDMKDNSLNNANKINAKKGVFSKVDSHEVNATGNIRTQGGLITQGNQGWLNETHGGGFYMSDNAWIRAINNKGIYTAGQVRGGSVRADDLLNAGGTLQLDQVNVVGAGCPQIGRQSRDAIGTPLSCQGGIWTAGGKLEVINGNNPTCPPTKIPVARYWTQAGGSNAGSYCTLQTGWAGVTTPSCESCENWEKCHMVYSRTWSATACS